MTVQHAEEMKPGFIVGVPRSGTTLLINLLGQHPLIAPLYETRFLRNLLVLCQSASWYYGGTISRRMARVACEPLVRSSFQRACAAYERKAVSYNIIPNEGNGIKQSYESFPFGESHCIHYHLEELVEETQDWLAQLRTGPVQPDEVYSSDLRGARAHLCR